MDGSTADDRTAAELSRWLAGADAWWGSADESASALLTRMRGLEDWKAEILPFLRPRLLQPGAAAAQGERAAYVVRLSESLYDGTRDFPAGIGPVEAIGTRLLGSVVSFEAACTEAEELGRHGDLIAPYAKALAFLLVQQAQRGDPAKALPLASVVLAMANAARPGTDVTPDGWTSWRWAADAYVEIACDLLCRRADLELYDRTRQLADSLVQWGAERDGQQRSKSLALLGHFLLTPFSANAGFLKDHDPWRSAQDPMKRGNPRSTYALREAAAVMSDAVEAGERRVDNRAWTQYVMANHMVAMFDPDVSMHRAHVDAAVSAARLALEHMPSAPSGDREYVEQVLRLHLSEQAQP